MYRPARRAHPRVRPYKKTAFKLPVSGPDHPARSLSRLKLDRTCCLRRCRFNQILTFK
jgi:hypothetical protein